MKLIKGMYRDSSLEEQPVGTWLGGTNLIYSPKYNELVNEPGFSQPDSILNGEGNIIGIISLPKGFVVFSILQDTTIANSRIGIYKDEVYTTILSANLNFNTNYPIFGEAYYNFEGELIVAWSDNHNTPKICNLDNLPFEVGNTTARNIVNNADAIYLEWFSEFKVPVYKLVSINDSTGSLNSGVYQVAIQYELPDGSFGNFSQVSNPIFIIQAGLKESWVNVHGCDANTPTSKSFTIRIYNIDSRYKRFRFGILHKVNGTYNAYISEVRNISSSVNDYVISSLEGYGTTTLTNIISKSASYTKIGAMTNIDNVLYIGNLEVEEEIRYQKYANNITVEYVYENTVSLNGVKGSHKDPVILFDMKSFMPGEVYALGIKFYLKGGHKTSRVFHIPGRVMNSGEDLPINSLGIYNNSKVFQFRDTCDDAGQMSYWENEKEKYPSESDLDAAEQEFNGAYDYNGDAIVGGVTLNNQLVRHHKFPSLRYLNNYDLEPLVDTNANLAIYYLSKAGSVYTNPYTKSLIFNYNSVPAEYVVDNRIINNGTSPIDYTLYFHLEAHFSFTNNGLPEVGTINLVITKNGSTVLYSKNSTTGYMFTTGDSLNVVLNPGEYIDIEGIAATVGSGVGYETVGSFSEYIQINDNLNHISADGDLFGKILGIKLSNIQLPDYIVEKCEYFEIVYAERNNDNSTVLGQGMLYKSHDFWHPRDESGLAFNTDFTRFNSYDLLSIHKQVNVTHVACEAYLEDKIFVSGSRLAKYKNGDPDSFSPVTRSNYLARHSFDDTDYNLLKEETLYLEVNQSYITPHPNGNINPYDPTMPAYADQNYMLTTAYSFKENVYLNYWNLKYVRTGVLHKILEIGTVATDNIYSGDVHFNLHGAIKYMTRTIDSSDPTWKDHIISYFLYPVYSIINIGYRYPGKVATETYFPKINFITSSSLITTVPQELRNRVVEETNSSIKSVNFTTWQQISAILDSAFIYDWQEYYSPISDNTSINNIEPHIIFNIDDEFITKFPYRIHKSQKQFEESKIQNWRTFLLNEYYDSISDKGEITQLYTDGQDLLILHKYSTLVARNIQELQTNNGIVSALGNSEIFSTKPIELVYDKSGYVGCQSKFSVTSCKYGIFIVDRDQGKIFLYKDSKIIDISTQGLERFLKANLQYSKSLLDTYNYYFDDGEVIQFDDGEPVEYRDATYSEKLEVDNPFTQFGIFTVWDEVNTRMLLCKSYYDENGTSRDSFTLSYYPELNQWGFFHSYIPNFSFNNRDGLFHIKNSILFKANNFEDNNQYFGAYGDIYIDIVVNTPVNVDKLLQSITWATKCFYDKVEQKDITFNNISIFNNLRYSGNIVLEPNLASDSNNIRLTGGTWKFNYLRDKLLEKDITLIDLNEIDILTPTGAVMTTDWTEFNFFVDPYFVVRLSYLRPRDILETKVDFKIFDITTYTNIIKR